MAAASEAASSSEPSAISISSPARLRRSLLRRASTRTGSAAANSARATAAPTNPVAPVTRDNPGSSGIAAQITLKRRAGIAGDETDRFLLEARLIGLHHRVQAIRQLGRTFHRNPHGLDVRRIADH